MFTLSPMEDLIVICDLVVRDFVFRRGKLILIDSDKATAEQWLIADTNQKIKYTIQNTPSKNYMSRKQQPDYLIPLKGHSA